MIVLIDMDEVLVDFIGGACRIHGVAREAMETARKDWDICEPLGHVKRGRGLSLDEFWEPIHAGGVEFWERLDKLPWFEEVIGWAENEFSNWFIISAPSKETNSYTGKVKWLKREFGRDFDRFFLTPHKEMLTCGENCILLDDKPDNIDKFVNHGGYGILFPSPGNRLREFADRPMWHVKNAPWQIPCSDGEVF